MKFKVSWALVLLVLFSPFAVQGEIRREYVVSAYLYNFAENIDWQGTLKESFTFHLISKNEDLEREMTRVARKKQVAGKSIRVSRAEVVTLAGDVQAVYVDKPFLDDFHTLAAAAEGRPVLLVTDGYTNRLMVQINLVDRSDKTIGFEINRANILNQGVGVKPEMVLLGGTEIDVAQLYREGQKSLIEQQRRLDALQGDITKIEQEKVALERILSQQKGEVDQHRGQLAEAENEVAALGLQLGRAQAELKRQAADLSQLKNETALQKETLAKQQRQIDEQKQTIKEQHTRMVAGQQRFEDLQNQVRSQEDNLRRQAAALQERETLLAKQQVEIDKRKGVLQQQADRIAGQDTTIREQERVLAETGSALSTQRYVSMLVSAVALLVVVLAATLWVGNRRNRRINLILTQQKARLEESAEALRKAKESADAANQAKSDFLARMSHEIRTPMNAVLGLTDVVLKSALSDQQQEYLKKVRLASGNLLKLIDDILDFSKVEAGRLELDSTPFILDDLLEQVVNLFGDRIGKKDLELILAVAPKVPHMLIGDSLRLSQVLTNLVGNAIKCTEQGEIMLGVAVDDGAGLGPDRVGLRFFVRDTGIGIAPELVSSLFEPFTQAGGYLTRRHEGVGLGLAICRRLVELMGGSIQARSTPGRGSTFSFTIPLARQEDKRCELNAPVDLHGLKTLVVDDNAWSRQVLVDVLTSFTFKVTAVDSGECALEELRRIAGTEPFRLVLLDWKMAGMNGFETAGQIANDALITRAGKPPIIIMVSAHGLEHIHSCGPSPPFEAYLPKPILPSQLFNTIMSLFGKDQALVVRKASGRVAPPTDQLAALRGRRVLLVEDVALNRDVVFALLEVVDMVVEAAETGKDAVDKVASAGHGYDIVLMDIQMPVMDGYEATRRIRQWEHVQPATIDEPETRLPIIALTAHALKGEKEKCIAAGMDDYLAKPIDEQELHRVLLRWIAKPTRKGGFTQPPALSAKRPGPGRTPGTV